MFVRRKNNKCGSVSIQVINKVGGKYRVCKSFGASKDKTVLSQLEKEARSWAEEAEYGPSLFSSIDGDTYDTIMSSIGQQQLRLVGPDLIYGRLFDKIGFNKIETKDNEIFKSLVVTRLYHPGSKLKTLRYLSYFMNKCYDENKIYRFLDNLCWRSEKKVSSSSPDIKHEVEQITYNHTKKVLNNAVSIVFYDTTTMYFESREDDVRIPGWSKDGKHSNTQIVTFLK